MKNCIVSFGNGAWYPRGVQRLKESCEKFGVEFILLTEYCDFIPHHSGIPYGFKPALIHHAFHWDYENVIWIDSSGWLQHDPSPIFDIIEKVGYFILNNHGQFNNWWCKDAQLNHFGFTREQARTQPHAVGGLVGFNRNCPYFKEYYDFQHLYKGQWNNDNRTESDSDECKGSRHDQSVLSLIVAKHGLKLHDQKGFVTFAPEVLDGIVAMRGM